MSWAGNESKQLRSGVKKVEYLWNEEEQHCLAERSQYADDSKCHSCKVAKCITHKYT